MTATGITQARPGLPRSILCTLAALTALVLSLFVSGAWLLFSPQTGDAASTWIATACLVTAGALIAPMRMLPRGSRAAWLLRLRK